MTTRGIYVLIHVMCKHVCGQVGGDPKPRPKQRPIRSPDRPGLPAFQLHGIEKLGEAWGTRLTILAFLGVVDAEMFE